MNKNLIPCAAALCACMLAPLAAKAWSPLTSDPASKVAPAAKTAADRDRVTYVIMRSGVTGSMIPTVYRVYHGVVTTSTSRDGAIYADLSPAGSESVGGSLTRLDPSITTTLHR